MGVVTVVMMSLHVFELGINFAERRSAPPTVIPVPRPNRRPDAAVAGSQCKELLASSDVADR
jgi:hypothetical protein